MPTCRPLPPPSCAEHPFAQPNTLPMTAFGTTIRHQPTSGDGFTLVELTVVLVIVALLIGGLMVPLSAQQDIRARQETDRKLSEIREALIGFAAANGRLPRPAISSAIGTERNTCTDDLDCTGFIPWAALGVDRIDSWDKLFRYSVTPAFANTQISLGTVANRKVKTRDNLGGEAYLAGQTAPCTTTNQCVPAVIFSHGKEHWGTSGSGLSLADGSATNVDEDTNENGPSDYFSRTPNASADASGGEFDDMVIWVPTTVLFNRMITTGKLP